MGDLLDVLNPQSGKKNGLLRGRHSLVKTDFVGKNKSHSCGWYYEMIILNV